MEGSCTDTVVGGSAAMLADGGDSGSDDGVGEDTIRIERRSVRPGQDAIMQHQSLLLSEVAVLEFVQCAQQMQEPRRRRAQHESLLTSNARMK